MKIQDQGVCPRSIVEVGGIHSRRGQQWDIIVFTVQNERGPPVEIEVVFVADQIRFGRVSAKYDRIRFGVRGGGSSVGYVVCGQDGVAFAVGGSVSQPTVLNRQSNTDVGKNDTKSIGCKQSSELSPALDPPREHER